MRKASLRRWGWLILLSGVLAACNSDNAASCASVISDGAKRLKSSALTSLSVRLDLGARKPYVVVIYPPFRTKADELLLDAVVPSAAAVSYGGAVISPKAEGFSNTLVVWQRGALATFNASFRDVAEAQSVLAVAKDDGSPAEVTLTKKGGQIYITVIR
ncbi:MAG: hypothetical protein ACHQQS_14225 [Thermoanaerobaculales bacterium]